MHCERRWFSRRHKFDTRFADHEGWRVIHVLLFISKILNIFMLYQHDLNGKLKFKYHRTGHSINFDGKSPTEMGLK